MKKKRLKKTALFYLLLIIPALTSRLSAQQTVYELWRSGKSVTYDDLINAYKNLDEKYAQATLLETGKTDIGEPLRLFVISDHADPAASIGDKNHVNILINNGIHPGEPDGIDACLFLAEQFLSGRQKFPKGINLCIIPVYNIGGMLNRGCCSRANQNGPEEYGFRGNGQNLDLNRDFIKADSKNAKSFYNIFHLVKPDIFIDTHVSNGADYQYTMTLLCTQTDKLGVNGKYCREKLLPYLYHEMEKKKFPLVPYVHSLDETPESGIIDFLETPRFATGYSTLFDVIGLTTETHMWKPYPARVQSTIEFILTTIQYADQHNSEIKHLPNAFRGGIEKPAWYSFNWNPDTSRFTMIDFLGYEAEYPESKIDQQPRLRYNREKPYQKKIRYYNHYIASDSVRIPEFYIIPQSWEKIIDLLICNKVKIDTIHAREEMQLNCYYIESFETVKHPYEGHYLHSQINTRSALMNIALYPGDFIIYTNQPNWRFIVEVLEPANTDSYFSWGFFDAVLQQKEWFSSYIFEDFALQMLIENPELKTEMENKIKNGEINDDHFSRLLFLYQHSPFYEKSHNRYPVYRSLQ